MRHESTLLFFCSLLFFVGVQTHRTILDASDQCHYLMIAESLYDDHDLWVENQYPDQHRFIRQLPKVVRMSEAPGGGRLPAQRDVAALPQRWPQTIPALGGHMYPLHDIGLPVLMLPVLSLVHLVVPRVSESFLSRVHLDRPALSSTAFAYQSILVAGLLTLLTRSILRRSALSGRVAFWGALLVMLTPPMMTHAFLFFTELYSAAVLVALCLLLRRSPRGVGAASLFSLGVALLCWLHVKNLALAFFAAALWAFANSGPGSRRVTLPRLLPLGVFVVCVLGRSILHLRCLGSPTPFAAWGGVPLSLTSVGPSILGMMLDREFGLILANPLLALLPAGLWMLTRERSDWWRIEGLLAAVYACGVLPFPVWWAGASPAGRHLLPIIPLLWIPVLHVVGRLWRGRLLDRISVAALFAVSLAITADFWFRPTDSWSFGVGKNLLVSRLPFFAEAVARSFPSFLRPEAGDAARCAVWIAVLVVVNLAVAVRVRAAEARG